MEGYNYYVAQAAYFRELADNLDGYQRLQVLEVVHGFEAKARQAKWLSQQPDPDGVSNSGVPQ